MFVMENFNNPKLRKDQRNLNKDRPHFYFDQMQPLMIINLILARQPYSRNASGEFELNFMSWRMAYCVLFYCGELATTLVAGHEVVVKMNRMTFPVAATNESSTPGYDVTIYTILLLLFLFAQLIVPLLNWMVAKRYTAFLNRWKRFEDTHLVVTGTNLRLANHAPLIRVYVLASLLVSAAIDAFESFFILSHLHWTRVLPFMFVTLDTLCVTATWAFSCHYIGEACRSIHASLQLTLSNRNSSQSGTIDAHRTLWLELCQLYDDYCLSQEYRLLTQLLLMLVCLVISSYGVVSALYASGAHSMAAIASFAVPVLYAICQLVVICECGHRASKKIGTDFCNKLDWIQSSTFTSQQWHEIETFIDCLETARPGARVCGIFTINRKLFMQVIYEIASYLIILVQLQAAGKN